MFRKTGQNGVCIKMHRKYYAALNGSICLNSIVLVSSKMAKTCLKIAILKKS